MTATPTVDWPAARQAVAVAGPRITTLLRSARRPDAPALGDWTLTQVAAHLSHAVDVVSAMSKGGGGILDDIWGLAPLTKVMVDGEGRRDPSELADRIDASVAAFLAAMDSAPEDVRHSWMVRGTQAPLSMLTCHVLNELTVHGRDIALAEGVPWPIERAHAVLILQGFLFPSLHAVGRSMVVQEAAGKVRARLEIRLRGGGGRVWLRFHYGDFTVEQSPAGPVDCYLSVDPEAFMLVAWGRIGQWPAIAKGQLVAWGRKPWLGPQLRSWLRNP